MSEEATSKAGKTWRYAVGILVSVPVLYVLSVGPVFVLVVRKALPPAVLVAYTPLDRFSRTVGFDDALENYARICLRLTGTPEP